MLAGVLGQLGMCWMPWQLVLEKACWLALTVATLHYLEGIIFVFWRKLLWSLQEHCFVETLDCARQYSLSIDSPFTVRLDLLSNKS